MAKDDTEDQVSEESGDEESEDEKSEEVSIWQLWMEVLEKMNNDKDIHNHRYAIHC